MWSDAAKHSAMLHTHWQMGCLIVEDAQQGNMRRFYLAFEKRETLSLELSWPHYNVLSRIENVSARRWYHQDAQIEKRRASYGVNK